MSHREFVHASVGKGKGCGIFSLTSKHKNGSHVKIIKEKYQVLSIIDGRFQLILLYLSSNCPMAEFVKELQNIFQPGLIPIVAGDVNFDKNEKNSLSKFLESRNFEQLVTDPTHDGGRTIDHCYLPKILKDKFQLIHHSPHFSDHDALLINVEV